MNDDLNTAIAKEKQMIREENLTNQLLSFRDYLDQALSSGAFDAQHPDNVSLSCIASMLNQILTERSERIK